jgi:glucosamine-phosphate N-acetyltransferase
MYVLQYDTLLKLVRSGEYNIGDIQESYMSLLSNLTITEFLDSIHFLNQVKDISKTGHIIVCYMVNGGDIQIIGSGTIFFEPKLIRGARPVGHIEDIVVDPKYRSLGVATSILEKLCDLGKGKNCYKIILDCKEDVAQIYVKSGFENRGIQMVKYNL